MHNSHQSALLFNRLKFVSISSLGGGLELYECVIYIFFSLIIAALFFPTQSYIASMLAVYGIFVIGYLARPLDGFVFWSLWRYSRSKTRLGHYNPINGTGHNLNWLAPDLCAYWHRCTHLIVYFSPDTWHCAWR